MQNSEHQRTGILFLLNSEGSILGNGSIMGIDSFLWLYTRLLESIALCPGAKIQEQISCFPALAQGKEQHHQVRKDTSGKG